MFVQGIECSMLFVNGYIVEMLFNFLILVFRRDGKFQKIGLCILYRSLVVLGSLQ